MSALQASIAYLISLIGKSNYESSGGDDFSKWRELDLGRKNPFCFSMLFFVLDFGVLSFISIFFFR